VEALLVVGAIVAIILWARQKDRTLKLERRIDRLEARLERLHPDEPKASSQDAPASVAPVPGPPAPKETPSTALSPVPPVVHEELRPAPAPVQVSPPAPAVRPGAPMPSLLSRLLGENPVVRIGLVVFLLGVSFLIRQVAQAGLFPPEARLAAAGLAGLGLLRFGWKVRTSRPHFSLPLQGGAMGVLFLTLFAAFRLYHILPAELSLGLAILLLALTGTLAVVQDSAALAYLGMAAGYASPLLLSSGTGSHIGLFTYYALLDAAIFGISWFRSWRALHVTAFLATYALGAAWGLAEYRSEHLLSCEIFVWVYYVLFSGTALLFSRRAYRNIFGYVDGTLFFGVPMATLALQYRLHDSSPWPMAWTAVVMALHNLAMARWIWSSIRSGRHPHLRVLAETLSVLGVSFASLAVPFAVSGPVTALVWAAEGAGLVFLGLRQDRKWSTAMGMCLAMAASGIQWFTERPDPIGTSIVALSLWICAWLLGTRAPFRTQRDAIATLLLGWMLLGATHDAWRFLEGFTWHRSVTPVHLTLAVASGLALLSTLGGWRLRFAPASLPWWPVTLAWFALVLGRGASRLAGMEGPLLSDLGWTTHLAFAPALGLGLFLIRRARLQGEQAQDGLQALLLHGLLWQGFVWSWIAARSLGGDWSLAAGLLALALPLLVAGKAPIQAFLSHLSPRLYRSAWLAPWWLGVCALAAATLLQPASCSPLPWLPILNPLDLTALLAVVAAILSPGGIASRHVGGLSWKTVCLGLCLAWCGTTLDRSFHHLGGLEWDFGALWESRALHAGWSLLLTSQALGLMLVAARRRLRVLWMGGATILAIAVLKLFLVDLSGHGATARIVSFLGMGALMVAIGFFSPLPPSETVAKADEAVPPNP